MAMEKAGRGNGSSRQWVTISNGTGTLFFERGPGIGAHTPVCVKLSIHLRELCVSSQNRMQCSALGESRPIFAGDFLMETTQKHFDTLQVSKSLLNSAVL